MTRKWKYPLAALGVLVASWLAIGVIFVVSIPFWGGAIAPWFEQKSGMRLSHQKIEGYFHIYRLGIRLSLPNIYDQQGLFIGSQLLELEFNPVAQLLEWTTNPIRVKIPGLKINVTIDNQANLRLQDRYEFSLRDQSAGKTPEWQDDVQDLLALFDLFKGRIDAPDASINLVFLPTHRQHTLSQINIELVGGNNASVLLDIQSPGVYGDQIKFSLSAERLINQRLRWHYLLYVRNLRESIVRDLLADQEDTEVTSMRLTARLTGSWSSLFQTHQIDYQMDELIVRQSTIPRRIQSDGLAFVSISEFGIELNSPRLNYLIENGEQSHAVVLNNLQYFQQLDNDRVVSLDAQIDRLLIERPAYQSLIDFKRRWLADHWSLVNDSILDLEINDFQLHVQADDQAINHATGQVQIHFAQIEKNSYFSNLAVGLNASDDKLIFSVSAAASELAIAQVSEPVNVHAIDAMTGELFHSGRRWAFRAQSNEIQLTPEQVVSLQLLLEFQPGYSPWLSLHFAAENLHSEVAQIYLPRLLLHPNLDRWLWRSVKGGRLTHGEIEYQGNVLLTQPAIHPERFAMQLSVTDMSLLYHPDWPAIDSINATVDIHHSGLACRLTGRYRNTELTAEARIENFAHPTLIVNANSKGDYADAQQFVINSPIASRLAEFFSVSRASGGIFSEHEIVIDLEDQTNASYQGKIGLKEIGLDLPAHGLYFSNFSGDLLYNQSQITSQQLTGQFAGRAVDINLSTVDEHRRVQVELLTHQEPAVLLRIPTLLHALQVQGSSAWYVRYVSPRLESPAERIRRLWRDERGESTPSIKPSAAHHSHLFIYSDLRGISLGQMTSVNKSADVAMPLTLTSTSLDGQRWRTQVALAEVLAIDAILDFNDQNFISEAHTRLFRYDPQTDQGNTQSDSTVFAPLPTTFFSSPTDPEVTKLRLRTDATWQGLKLPAFTDNLPTDHIIFGGELAEISFSRWSEHAARQKERTLSENEPRELLNDVRRMENATDGRTYVFDLIVDSLEIFGRYLHDVQLNYTFIDKMLDAQLNSQDLDFNLLYDAGVERNMSIKINHLDYQSPKDQPAESPATESVENQLTQLPASIPEQHRWIYHNLKYFNHIELSCRLCRFDRVTLHNLTTELSSVDDGIDISIVYGDERIKEKITVDGRWQMSSDDDALSSMNSGLLINLDSQHVDHSIRNHGGSPLIDSQRATAEIQLNWQGSLLQFNYPSLNGYVKVGLDKGKIHNIDTSNVRRLLSLVNLLELPRRFSFDISDLNDSYEFYRAHFEAVIDNGVFKLDNQNPMHLRSSLGVMNAYGRLDFTQQKYDLSAQIIPSVVAFTLPTLALAFGGSVAGLSVIGLNWLLTIFGVDANRVVEQFSMVDSSFDKFEPKFIDQKEFKLRLASYQTDKERPSPTTDDDPQPPTIDDSTAPPADSDALTDVAFDRIE